MVGLTYITTRSRAPVESTTSSTVNTLVVRRVTLMRLSRSSASTCPVTDSAKMSPTAVISPPSPPRRLAADPVVVDRYAVDGAPSTFGEECGHRRSQLVYIRSLIPIADRDERRDGDLTQR